MGMAEMIITSEGLAKRRGGNILYHKGNQDRGVNGVGFLTIRRLEHQIKEIVRITNERLAYVKQRINRRYNIMIIQTYFPFPNKWTVGWGGGWVVWRYWKNDDRGQNPLYCCNGRF